MFAKRNVNVTFLNKKESEDATYRANPKHDYLRGHRQAVFCFPTKYMPGLYTTFSLGRIREHKQISLVICSTYSSEKISIDFREVE